MNIALITITYNDDCRFDEWYQHYQEYKESLYLHIIVDNNSRPDYQDKLWTTFKDSIVIELGYNGGCTTAYNKGISYAMKDPNVDAISLMGNDIKIPGAELVKLYKFLYSNDYGMVFPIVQNPRVGSEITNSFGNTINTRTFEMMDDYHGVPLRDLPSDRICETGPGGCNMAKPSFYRTIGLQDEKLFMYSDEVDMGTRAKHFGIKMAVTKESVAWHLHINPPGQKTRSNLAPFLISRNKIYLSKKYGNWRTTIAASLRWMSVFFLSSLSSIKTRNFFEMFPYNWSYARGVFAGLIGNMKNNF